jgi:hypothetical protein
MLTLERGPGLDRSSGANLLNFQFIAANIGGRKALRLMRRGSFLTPENPLVWSCFRASFFSIHGLGVAVITAGVSLQGVCSFAIQERITLQQLVKTP